MDFFWDTFGMIEICFLGGRTKSGTCGINVLYYMAIERHWNCYLDKTEITIAMRKKQT